MKLTDDGKFEFNLIDRLRMGSSGIEIIKSMEKMYRNLSEKIGEAKEENPLINTHLDWQSNNNVQSGVAGKVGLSFATLREMSYTVDPIIAIINERIRQVTSFSRRVDARRGRVQTPGFRIRLNSLENEASAHDMHIIDELERYIEETGFVEPPENEKPDSWTPGFDSFLSQIVRDSLTFDWVCVRTWPASKNPEKYPIVAFCAEDAGLIRRTMSRVVGLKHGVPMVEEYQRERKNTSDDIKYVMYSDIQESAKIAEFTSKEMFHWIRNPRTDVTSYGYGFSEMDQCWVPATIWLNARTYNAVRFRKDSVPKGFITLFSNMNEQQFMQFRLAWKQMCEGPEKAWSIPIIKTPPAPGNVVQWNSIDPSPRDMEYHQFMFMVSIWIHSIFGIHPEETGYEALSPFKPPLSEASPEVKLKASQDSGLTPLLRKIEDMINRNIIWKLYPTKKYRFEFVGIGDYDEMQDVQTRSARLAAGLSTPRQEWAELDQAIPKELADSPAWDLPMPIMQGLQYVTQMEDRKAQEEILKQTENNAASDNQISPAETAELMGDENAIRAQDEGEAAPENPLSALMAQIKSNGGGNPNGENMSSTQKAMDIINIKKLGRF